MPDKSKCQKKHTIKKAMQVIVGLHGFFRLEIIVFFIRSLIRPHLRGAWIEIIMIDPIGGHS